MWLLLSNYIIDKVNEKTGCIVYTYAISVCNFFENTCIVGKTVEKKIRVNKFGDIETCTARSAESRSWFIPTNAPLET